MKHKVPKFLERETKFFSLFTFKQLIILGIIGLGFFLLYYIIPKHIFFSLLISLGGITVLLMAVQIEGIPLYQLVVQFFIYLTSSKKFIWQKKQGSFIKLVKREREEEKEKEEKTPLKIFAHGKIHKLSSMLQMGKR